MSMSKKDFIALADAIKEHNHVALNGSHYGMVPFSIEQLDLLAFEDLIKELEAELYDEGERQ